MIQHFEQNLVGRDFVVGDIHGMFRALECKLCEVAFDEEVDRLFSVGDLIDRGPDSHEFWEWLEKPWFHAVRGNHEQMLIDYVDGNFDPRYEFHYHNAGGLWTYGMDKSFLEEMATLCDNLPIAIEIQGKDRLIGIVHAEVPFDDWDMFKNLYAYNRLYCDNIALWERKRCNNGIEAPVKGIDTVYVGHTPGGIATLGNIVYIDTGACFRGGKLTIVEV